MAKILGGIASGLTIAGLFRTSFEIIDIIHFTRNQKPDYAKLRLRLEIEKCRLRVWGESMGLFDNNDSSTTLTRTVESNIRCPEAVREILMNIITIFDGAEKIKDKYGCRMATSADLLVGDNNQGSTSNALQAAASRSMVTRAYISPARQVKQTITWVISDRKKFATLIEEIRDLIDKLKEITALDNPTDVYSRYRRQLWSPGFQLLQYERPKL